MKYVFKLFILCQFLTLVLSSWTLTCKLCAPQLEYCLSIEPPLVGEEFIQCMKEISYIPCQICAYNIQDTPILICQESLDYHRISCETSCRLKGLISNSNCDLITGMCICY